MSGVAMRLLERNAWMGGGLTENNNKTHLESLVDAGPAEGLGTGAVGLVEAGLEYELDAHAVRHLLDLAAHLEDVLLGLDDVGPSHQEEGIRGLLNGRRKEAITKNELSERLSTERDASARNRGGCSALAPSAPCRTCSPDRPLF